LTRLVATLNEFCGPIEADLAFRGIDLRDLWRPGGGASKLTYRRRLGVLLNGLPGHSTYKTAVRDSIPDEELAELAKKPRDKHGVWSHEALRLAALEDQVKLLRRDIVAVLGGKLSGEFEPTPRPGVAPAKKRRALSAEGFAYLMKIRLDHERANGYGIGAKAG
jgi:hypothetical protein